MNNEQEKRIEESLRKGLTPLQQPSHGSPIPRKAKLPEATTYFEMSQMSIGMDNNDHAFLVGSGGAPPFPPSVWEADIGNLEAPLGEEVNAFEPVGTHAEIAASLPPETEEEL
jgi:hypothetical protein